MSYVKSISDTTMEGDTNIVGEQVYGRVMSYLSKQPQDCRIEAHNKYVDIQITISGVEGIEVFDRKMLRIETSYNEKNDVEFFIEDKNARFADIKNRPGYFTMFFPEDAHRPMMAIDGDINLIKKYVIKIDKLWYV